jgi:hypothetical protein
LSITAEGNSNPTPAHATLTNVLPSSESVTNYVAFTWAEFGQPCFRVTKSRTVRLARHVASIREKRHTNERNRFENLSLRAEIILKLISK